MTAPYTALLAMILALCSDPRAKAEEPLPAKQEAEGANTANEAGAHVVPIPAVYYTPETQLAYGAVLMILYPSENPRRTSKFQPSLIHTTRNQVLAHFVWNHYFANHRLSMFTQFARFPDLYYGIGIDSKASAEEEYTPIYADNDLILDWLVNEHCSFGIGHSYRRYQVIESERGGLIDQGLAPNSDQSTAIGGVARVTYDTRDNQNSARSGILIDLQGTRYQKELGGLQSYSLFETDFRRYLAVSDSLTLAAKFSTEWTSGNTPFRELPMLGGVNLMRGLYRGRFRDLSRTSLQTEVRFPIGDRFSGVVFAAAGTVAGTLEELPDSEMKYSGGSGARFFLVPEKRVSLRLDIGFSEDGSGVYFSLNEAF